MPTFGLGNFLYDVSYADGHAIFKFYDPEDTSNTAEVSLGEKDFDGFRPDSRQVADKAYAQAAKGLNKARNDRLAKQAADALTAKQEEEQRVSEASAAFLNNAQDLADTTPTGSAVEAQPDQLAPAHNNAVQDTVPDDSESKSDKKSK